MASCFGSCLPWVFALVVPRLAWWCVPAGLRGVAGGGAGGALWLLSALTIAVWTLDGRGWWFCMGRRSRLLSGCFRLAAWRVVCGVRPAG